MEVRGPCLLTFHNGKPCQLYEVATSQRSMKGYSNARYFFTRWEDAEIYVYYLYQVAGVDFIERVLTSKKMPQWEKKEYRAFLETLDLSILENLVQSLHPIIEKSFVPHLAKRNPDGTEDDTDDDCGEYGC